jgi:outer membrane protein W
MKQLFFSILMFATVGKASAQKSSWYIGGNAGFNSSTSKFSNATTTVDGGKTTSWQFSPEVGTFITNNIQVGAGFTFAGSKVDDQDTPTSTIDRTSNAGVTAYVRNFFGKENFRPFVGFNISTLQGRSESKTGSATVDGPKNSTFGTNLNAGFAYSLNKRVSVLGSVGVLGFNTTTSKFASGNKSTSTNFGFDAQTLGNRFNIGFYYTFLTGK